jgi:methionyl-tRNA formyltransferase
MDIVFLGINDIGWEIYNWLCDRSGVTVRALVTRPDQISLVERLDPDIVVAVGYAHIVPEEILAVPSEGCVNVHPGYLPHARGYNPNVWSIVEDLPAGATVHYMDPGVDTGDIIARMTVESTFADTGKSLYERIERACFELFREAWSDIEDGNVNVTEQDDSESTHHYQSDFESLCRLDPDRQYTPKELLDILRALTFPPFNNARLDVDGETYYIEVDITKEDEVEDTDQSELISSY